MSNPDEPAYVYSHNGEYWYEDSWEVANLALEDDDTRTHIERGVANYPTASSFVPRDFASFLSEQAGGSHDEWAEEWLEHATQEQRDVLQRWVEAVVDSWASVYNLQPRFYTVSSPHDFPIPEDQIREFLAGNATQSVSQPAELVTP